MNNRPDIEILLVEDDPHDAELTMHTLRRHNPSDCLVHVEDGASALQWLEQHVEETPGTVRIVLLDLKLPKLDGIQVLQRIKSNPRMRHIPVVMMTSSRQEEDVLRSYELGVNSYVVKPLQFTEFTRVVAALGQYWINLNTTLASR